METLVVVVHTQVGSKLVVVAVVLALLEVVLQHIEHLEMVVTE